MKATYFAVGILFPIKSDLCFVKPLMSGVLIASNDTLKANEGLLTDMLLRFINKVNKEYGVWPITVGNNTCNKQYDTFEV